MLTIEILHTITLVTSILGIVISVIFWLEIKRLSIYIPYALFTFLYIFISVFESNDLPPYTIYTDTFYWFEIITSLILIIGMFYYKANINLKTSIENRYFRLFPLIVLSSLFICTDGIIPFYTLIFTSVSIFYVLKKNAFRVICRVIIQKLNFLDIILLLVVITYFISGDLIEKIGFAIATSNNSSAVFEYRTEVYNGAARSIIDNIVQFFCLSLVPFFGIYYCLNFLDSRKIHNFLKAIIFLTIGAIVAFSTLGKARITYYIAGLILSITIRYVSLRKKSSFNILTLFFPLLAGYLIIQFMYSFTGNISGQENFYDKFIVRLLQVPVQSNSAYFEIFPSMEKFQLTGNHLTTSILLFPIRNLFGIDISDKAIESVVSYRLTGIYFGYVSSGFATAYSQWGLFSPIISGLFIISTIQIDGILNCISDNRKIYSVYCYIMTMMPVASTVSYNNAVGLFGMWLIPLFFIFLYFLDVNSTRYKSSPV